MILEWWRERRKTKFMKDLCKIISHEWDIYPTRGGLRSNKRSCIRCGIVQISKVWEDGDYVWD